MIKRLPTADAQALTRSELKRKHLEAKCKYKTLWESHFEADRYKIEFDKSCWRQQLRNIQANNGGALPPAAIRKCYAEFKCEFGCPPPRMSLDEFFELKPVPRPKLPASANTGKYLTFAETFGTPTPYSVPDLKEASTVELAPSGAMLQGNVRTSQLARASEVTWKWSVFSLLLVFRASLADPVHLSSAGRDVISHPVHGLGTRVVRGTAI